MKQLCKIVVPRVGNIERDQHAVGVVCVQNGCCPGRPVLIVRAKFGREEDNNVRYQFYARCVCGKRNCRRTHMNTSVGKAIWEYEHLKYVRQRGFCEYMAKNVNRLAMLWDRGNE